VSGRRRAGAPPSRRRWAVLAAVAAAAALAGAGCGVEVPEEVAARATSTTTTVAPGPATTAPPTSADPLEQALIDNGYTVEEARCGAERLRQVLDDDEVQAIVEAESLDDIDPDTAARFAAALRRCVEGAGDPGEGGDPGGGGGEDPGGDDDGRGDDGDPPGRRGGPLDPDD